jgi:hypothetical protein
MLRYISKTIDNYFWLEPNSSNSLEINPAVHDGAYKTTTLRNNFNDLLHYYTLPHQNLREQHGHRWQAFSSSHMILWYTDCLYIICAGFFLVPRVSWILLVNCYIYGECANHQVPIPTETKQLFISWTTKGLLRID